MRPYINQITKNKVANKRAKKCHVGEKGVEVNGDVFCDGIRDTQLIHPVCDV